MKVNIITTVKNGSDYILETLENIKLQTFKEFEHIIVDDGSTDDTVEKILKFKEENIDYTLHLFQPGALGRGKALNFAVSKANYDWIAIIDADDFWHPQKLEKQMELITKNPEIDLLSTQTKLCFDTFDQLTFDKITSSGSLKFFNLYDFLRTNHINHSSVLMRKKIALYDENRKSQFDLELWLRLAKNRKILTQSSLLLSYRRIHEQQSFEGKMKKVYRWRSYKLKMKYCLLYFNLYSLFYNTLKFGFDMIFSREIRFKIREILKKQ